MRGGRNGSFDRAEGEGNEGGENAAYGVRFRAEAKTVIGEPVQRALVAACRSSILSFWHGAMTRPSVHSPRSEGASNQVNWGGQPGPATINKPKPFGGGPIARYPDPAKNRRAVNAEGIQGFYTSRRDTPVLRLFYRKFLIFNY